MIVIIFIVFLIFYRHIACPCCSQNCDSACHSTIMNFISIVPYLLSLPITFLPQHRNDGWTSLMFASFRNHSIIVANLLAHRADSTTVTSRWGYTALDIARNEGHADVVKLLEAHQRLSRSKAAVRLQTEKVRPSEAWELKLLKCGSCGTVLSRGDFTSHCIELHADDKNFNWKSSDGTIVLIPFSTLPDFFSSRSLWR